MDATFSMAEIDRESARRATHLLRSVAVVVILCSALYAVILPFLTWLGAQTPRLWVSTMVPLGVQLLVTVVAAMAALRGRPTSLRHPWRFFLLASLAALCAAALRATQSLLTGASLPSPSTLDLLYLLSYPLYMLGLLFYPLTLQRGLVRLKLTVDATFATLVTSMGVGYILLVPGTMSPAPLVMWLYPLANALLVAMLLALLSGTHKQVSRLIAAVLSVGFSLEIASDLAQAHFAQRGVPVLPAWVGAIWLLASGCMAWAGLYTVYGSQAQPLSPEAQHRVEKAISNVGIALRAGVSIAAMAIAVSDWALFANGATETLLLAVFLAVIALLGARYVLVRVIGEQLYREVQRSVEERTGQLAERVAEVQQLRAEAEQRADEQEALLCMAGLVTSSLRLDDVLSTVVQQAADLLHAEDAILYLYDEASTMLEMQAHITPYLSDVQVQAWKRIPLAVNPAAVEVVRTKRPVLIADSRKDSRIPPALVELGIVSSLLVPLLVKEKILGLLILNRYVRGHSTQIPPLAHISASNQMHPTMQDARARHSTQTPPLAHISASHEMHPAMQDALGNALPLPSPFTQHDMHLALALARHASIAIENARLYAELGARMEELKRVQADLVRSQRLQGLGQMVAGAAHELNNPLTVVQGYTELLLRQDLSPQARADVQRILEAVGRCQSVVRNLLAFGQRVPAQRRPTDVNEILERVLSLHQFDLEASSISVKRQLATDLLPISGDASLLQQAFFNIILNAQQAMSEAHHRGILTLSSYNLVRETGSVVRIEISDDGPGIPPETMDKIFDPFFTTRRPGEGMGLGLSLCFGVVQEHGGRIWAESPARQQYGRDPGPGTTIIVELPAM